MWRISVGDRPFHDFIESHPPFVWYLGAPLLRVMPATADTVSVLRYVAAIFGLAFVGLVLANAQVGKRRPDIPWLIAGGLLMLSNSRNLDFFLEIRPDSVAYVLLFSALLLFRLGKPAPLFARYSVFAFLSATAVLWNPKPALFVVIFALADLILHM